MFRLATILYSLVGTTLAGSAVIAALVGGHDTVQGIVTASAAGAALAVPVSLLVARKLAAG